MNAAEYLESVKRATDGLTHLSTGACATCGECQDEHGWCCEHSAQAAIDDGYSDEGGFSWSPCDCCGSHLGGDRFDAHGIADDKSILHLSVCVDCVQFIANGTLPESES